MAFQLKSPAFQDHAIIPERFTCEGDNISPPLEWKNPPKGAKTLALIVEDPDAPNPLAPKKTWDHWVLYNLPVEFKKIEEDYADVPKGSLQGLNSWKKIGYGGPCPPVGQHRYFFRLFALDTCLDNLKKPDKTKLQKAMKGHVLAEATLMGVYQRKRTSAI